MAEPLEQLFHLDEDRQTGSKTLVSEAYHQLRCDIVEGRLKPGQKLRTEHLKDRYHVGAATLREALALLAADALVVSQQQRGFRVAPMSIADFHDITQTRAMLETHAVRLAIAHGDDDWEAGLSAAFHKLSRAEERLHRGEIEMNAWEDCNRRFHEQLIAGSASRWTRHFLAILYRQSERYRRLALLNAPPERDIHQEHQAIFEATIARDAERAGQLIEQHIRETLNVVTAIVPFDDQRSVASPVSGTASSPAILA